MKRLTVLMFIALVALLSMVSAASAYETNLSKLMTKTDSWTGKNPSLSGPGKADVLPRDVWGAVLFHCKHAGYRTEKTTWQGKAAWWHYGYIQAGDTVYSDQTRSEAGKNWYVARRARCGNPTKDICYSKECKAPCAPVAKPSANFTFEAPEEQPCVTPCAQPCPPPLQLPGSDYRQMPKSNWEFRDKESAYVSAYWWQVPTITVKQETPPPDTCGPGTPPVPPPPNSGAVTGGTTPPGAAPTVPTTNAPPSQPMDSVSWAPSGANPNVAIPVTYGPDGNPVR